MTSIRGQKVQVHSLDIAVKFQAQLYSGFMVFLKFCVCTGTQDIKHHDTHICIPLYSIFSVQVIQDLPHNDTQGLHVLIIAETDKVKHQGLGGYMICQGLNVKCVRQPRKIPISFEACLHINLIVEDFVFGPL